MTHALAHESVNNQTAVKYSTKKGAREFSLGGLTIGFVGSVSNEQTGQSKTCAGKQRQFKSQPI